MKYAVQYRKGFKYLDQVDEINILFRREDTTLVDFLLLHQKQRINISIYDIEDFIESNSIKLFDAIAIEHPEINFAINLGYYHNSESPKLMKIIKERVIPHKFFFNDFVRNWDTLHGLKDLGVSDMYIVEDLGFELDAVGKILHSAGIQVRVFPNIAQSPWIKTPALKKFFIRPDDIEIYEPYVDVIEFFGSDDSIETYYKIYAIDKKWFGKLNEVIIDFDDDRLDSRFLLPIFGERRLKCGKRCLKGSSCNICSALEVAAATLEANNLIIKTKKE